MVMIQPNPAEPEYYMDGYLKSNLEPLKELIKKDNDFVIIIDGGERLGKSVLAQQIAKFLDPTFTLERDTIGLKHFENAVQNAKPYQAVIGDEVMRLLSSRGAMSKVNKKIVQLLAEIGQKNLFVILNLPSFFELDKYAAIWRSIALIHVYSGPGLEKGYFKFYNGERKKSLYINGKKNYDYYKVKPNFIGRFTNHYTIDEKAYREYKARMLRDFDDYAEDNKLMKTMMLWKEDTNQSWEKISLRLGLPMTTVHTWVRNYMAEQKERKVQDG